MNSAKILVLVALAWSPQVFSSADIKMGVVDMQSVILSVEEGKKARAALEQEIKAKEKRFSKEERRAR